MRSVLLIVAAAACGGSKPAPRASMYGDVASERGGGGGPMKHVLGARLHVGASWQASCTDWSAVFDNMLEDRDERRADETEPCKGKPFELEVSCSSRCAQHGPRTAVGSASVVVIPEELGPLNISVTSRRTDTGQTKTTALPGVFIVLPDRLELRCQIGRESHQRAACGPEGVPAANPWLEAIVHVLDRQEPTTALRINGKALDDKHGQTFSLADIYPDAAEGDGVKPGTYPITLSVGETTSTWQVVAR